MIKVLKGAPQLLDLSRRRFITGLSALGVAATTPLLSASAKVLQNPQRSQVLAGNQFDLSIGYQSVNFTGKERIATVVNGSLPAPVLRWREGERITLRVTNHLAHDTSLHWHGLILPSDMDGVPGMSFAGIKPGETFTYQFDVKQSGTYWYHSHSGFQEQTGLYGAIVIDSAEPEPFSYDRDYVVLLSDWSDEKPERIYANLKKMSHYYNRQERTASDLWQEIQHKGVAQTWQDRSMWNQMRMSDRDLADVTGETYTYLMNGNTPDNNWQAVFKRGEKIRLRFINGSAMSIFDVRIPGLKMTVVAADGQAVEPVTVEEFRIGTAETYDVIVEPSAEQAYTLFAQSIDRSGYARGTLTPDLNLAAKVPVMDEQQPLGHREMGMTGMTMAAAEMKSHDMMGHGHHKMHNMAAMKKSNSGAVHHAATEFGPQVDMRVEKPVDGVADPGFGLRNNGRRVLSYADLRNLYPTEDQRQPGRDIELHLTGNMMRYMWSMDGIKFADAEPLHLRYGERVRITLVNDTMMAHPIHLHGMWSELETGDVGYLPRKHTVLVQPGAKISYQVSANALGVWAYHCHLLYHMPGMARKVVVSEGAVT
ncbi:Multicopper oxidase [gamma proteobacterium IMCC2047]|nr:Multicopper oxidase [gamma proteobacterium IMCC2047]